MNDLARGRAPTGPETPPSDHRKRRLTDPARIAADISRLKICQSSARFPGGFDQARRHDRSAHRMRDFAIPLDQRGKAILLGLDIGWVTRQRFSDCVCRRSPTTEIQIGI
jgi:hypothetical protein